MQNIQNDLSRTVYSLCYPKTKNVFENLMNRRDIHEMYSETWTKKQDNAHEKLAAAWLKWTAPLLEGVETFPNFYPTNGSSEAIRECIVLLKEQGKTLTVFNGEYEGYEMIAKAINMPILKIDRESWQEGVAKLDSRNVFFLSQPSAIDGNHFLDFDKFLAMTLQHNIELCIDLTYLGSSTRIIKLNLGQKNISHVFFSLSKVFGVYYHRIGGVFTREPNALLYGNMWFKNMLSITYGTLLLESTENIFEVSRLAAVYQDLAIQKINHTYNLNLMASDVVLLATLPQDNSDWQSSFVRNPNSKLLRVCITPTMERLIYNEKYQNC